MATKTIILRPTHTFHYSGSNTWTYFPEDTSLDNGHLLISEEVADDDSTYITATGKICFDGFLFTVPTDILNITPMAIRVIFRMRTTITNSLGIVNYRNPTLDSYEPFDAVTLSDQYTTYIQNIPSEYKTAFWDELLAPSADYTVSFYGDTTSTDSKAKHDVILTQLYLEVDYDDGTGGEETTETIYLKENGSWTSIPCTIYQKQNGAWVTTDSSILENGDKFILQEVT